MTKCILPNGDLAEILGPVTAATPEGLLISHTEFFVRLSGISQPITMTLDDLRGAKFPMSVLKRVHANFEASYPEVLDAWDRHKAVCSDL